MIHKVETYIQTHRLLTSDKPVIVGFSGGSDSVSLLFILNRLGYKCIAAHCNFRLRESESERDASFCGKFAEQQHILFETVDFDTKLHAAQQSVSIEMAARELRYAWFETLRVKYDAQAIAVAHHCDDSNETMLLNLIRGTGIRGLCGIRPQNGWVVRPLLCVHKDEINRFVDEHQLSFVTDSSNLSDEYTRNIIRLRLLPVLKEINPSVETALVRTAEHLADVEHIYLQTIEDAKKTLLKTIEDDVFSISIQDLLRLTAPKTILYELLQPFGFTRPLAENIFHSLSGESGKIFDAPCGGYQLLKDRTSLLIYRKPLPTTECYQIEENDAGTDHPIRLSMCKVKITPTFKIDKSPLTASFDYEKISFPLTLRKRQSGDWFYPFGMNGKQKVSDYFSDHKFSILQKNKTWLLCSGKNILWIVGERTDNRFCISKNTKYALIIKFITQKNCK